MPTSSSMGATFQNQWPQVSDVPIWEKNAEREKKK
jgi:hypothetical protein